MKLLVTITFLVITIFSCGSYADKDFNLSQSERSFLNVFKSGDTLTFKNSNNEIDKLVVVGLDSSQKKKSGTLMASPAHNFIWVTLKHIQPVIWRTYSQKGSLVRIDTTISQELITISKYPQSKEITFSFSFKHFYSPNKNGFGPLHTDTIKINGFHLTKYYVLSDKNSDTLNMDVSELYWTQNHGLVAYKLYDGTYWCKINGR